MIQEDILNVLFQKIAAEKKQNLAAIPRFLSATRTAET
jgi:hypothetical protein